MISPLKWPISHMSPSMTLVSVALLIVGALPGSPNILITTFQVPTSRFICLTAFASWAEARLACRRAANAKNCIIRIIIIYFSSNVIFETDALQTQPNENSIAFIDLTNPLETPWRASHSIFPSQLHRRQRLERRKGRRELKAWSEPPLTSRTDGQFQGAARSAAVATQGKRHPCVFPPRRARSVS